FSVSSCIPSLGLPRDDPLSYIIYLHRYEADRCLCVDGCPGDWCVSTYAFARQEEACA
ncbi:hypothetical protein CSUI_009692, partial [Cystoisospora suis]